MHGFSLNLLAISFLLTQTKDYIETNHFSQITGDLFIFTLYPRTSFLCCTITNHFVSLCISTQIFLFRQIFTLVTGYYSCVICSLNSLQWRSFPNVKYVLFNAILLLYKTQRASEALIYIYFQFIIFIHCHLFSETY